MFLSGPRGAAARTPVRLLAATLAGLLATPAAAQPFFAGETVELLSGNSDGSTLNTIWRAFGEHAERLHPGLRVVFRPNAGGSAALTATLIAEAAPDGLTIGTVDMDTIIGKANGDVAYAITDFAVLGALRADLDVLLASTRSGITSVEQLVPLDRPVILPVRSANSGAYYQTQMINAWLGTRIRAVTGYDTGTRVLALLSGEAQVGLLGDAISVQLLGDGSAVSLLKLVDFPSPPIYGEPPALSEFAGDPEFAWVPAYLNAAAQNLILVTHRQTPADRLAALRGLFMEVANDPLFQAEVRPIAVIDPTHGDDLESLLADITAGDFGARLARAVACGVEIAETGDC